MEDYEQGTPKIRLFKSISACILTNNTLYAIDLNNNVWKREYNSNKTIEKLVELYNSYLHKTKEGHIYSGLEWTKVNVS